MSDFEKICHAVLDGEDELALAEAEQLLAAGKAPLTIINDGLIAAMSEVGRLFKEGDLFVPEVMMSAHTVAGVIEALRPHLGAEAANRGRIVIGTVKGDLHDIGKNLVALLLSSNGFTVIDLGNDVAPERFLQAAEEHRADIVGLSALLTTTMSNMRATIEAFVAAGRRDSVRIIIGGAPVTADYAAEICADGYSEDATEAVELCRRLMEVGA